MDWPSYCSADVRALPDGRTWVTICDRHERRYFLQLIDRERLGDAGRGELAGGDRYPAGVVAWHVATDGTVISLGRQGRFSRSRHETDRQMALCRAEGMNLEGSVEPRVASRDLEQLLR